MFPLSNTVLTMGTRLYFLEAASRNRTLASVGFVGALKEVALQVVGGHLAVVNDHVVDAVLAEIVQLPGGEGWDPSAAGEPRCRSHDGEAGASDGQLASSRLVAYEDVVFAKPLDCPTGGFQPLWDYRPASDRHVKGEWQAHRGRPALDYSAKDHQQHNAGQADSPPATDAASAQQLDDREGKRYGGPREEELLAANWPPSMPRGSPHRVERQEAQRCAGNDQRAGPTWMLDTGLR